MGIVFFLGVGVIISFSYLSLLLFLSSPFFPPSLSSFLFPSFFLKLLQPPPKKNQKKKLLSLSPSPFPPLSFTLLPLDEMGHAYSTVQEHLKSEHERILGRQKTSPRNYLVLDELSQIDMNANQQLKDHPVDLCHIPALFVLNKEKVRNGFFFWGGGGWWWWGLEGVIFCGRVLVDICFFFILIFFFFLLSSFFFFFFLFSFFLFSFFFFLFPFFFFLFSFFFFLFSFFFFLFSFFFFLFSFFFFLFSFFFFLFPFFFFLFLFSFFFFFFFFFFLF